MSTPIVALTVLDAVSTDSACRASFTRAALTLTPDGALTQTPRASLAEVANGPLFLAADGKVYLQAASGASPGPWYAVGTSNVTSANGLAEGAPVTVQWASGIHLQFTSYNGGSDGIFQRACEPLLTAAQLPTPVASPNFLSFAATGTPAASAAATPAVAATAGAAPAPTASPSTAKS